MSSRATVLVCLLSLALEASAAPILFSDPTAFYRLVGAPVLSLDFESLAPGQVDGSSVSPDITFSSPEAANPSLISVFSVIGDRRVGDSGGASPNNVGPFRGDFAAPVGAISMTRSNSSVIATVSLFDENDALIGQLATPTGDGFFGIVSDVPISSFEFQGGLFADPETPGYRDRNLLDDLSAFPVVPEPSAGLLLGIGLLGVATRTKRPT